jgi:hypothetical protein
MTPDELQVRPGHSPQEIREALARRLRDETLVEPFAFLGGAAETEVAEAERSLGVRFPESYRWFLKEFGGGEIRCELLGVSTGLERTVVADTRAQAATWPQQWKEGPIVIAVSEVYEGMGRWEPCFICLDPSLLVEGEWTVTDWRPTAEPEYRLFQTGETFLQWLDRELDLVERSPDPPRDWHDAAAWERYWRRVTANAFHRNCHAGPLGSGALAYLPQLREQQLRRILFAGNGISEVPHAFVHSGFEVTVLDVSPAASQLVASTALSPDDLIRYFPEFRKRKGKPHEMELDESRSRERVAREHRAGGRLVVLTEDLFHHMPAEPYDAISSARALQGFSPDAQRSLLSRFGAWVVPGAICIVETMNVWDEVYRRFLEETAAAAGFFLQQNDAVKWWIGHPDVKRSKLEWKSLRQEYARRIEIDTRADEARLNAGEKMIVFWHGSG